MTEEEREREKEETLKEWAGKQERFCDHIQENILPLGDEDQRERLEALLDMFRNCEARSLALVLNMVLSSCRHDLELRRTPISIMMGCPDIYDMINLANPQHCDRLFDYLAFWVDLGDWLLGGSPEACPE